jgi:glucose/mannose-6-phosphate isomerase
LPSWPLDTQGFLRHIAAKSDQVEAGFRAGKSAGRPGTKPAGLLFAGMGFSGATADLVKDACTRVMDMPFTIVRHYQFPRHVKSDWHVLAISHSGETEETVSVAREAIRRGCDVTSFSTGGRITGLAQRNVVQPVGGQPRAMLAHSWFSMLGYLEATGLLAEPVPIRRAVAAVQEVDAACGPGVPESANEAKQLARKLWDRVPQIYATPAFFGVGLVFRALLNENAKKIAHVDLVPECNHNDLTGWGGDTANRRHFTAVMLSHANQNPEIKKRIRFMRERYTEWGVPWHHHEFPGIDTFGEHVVEQARALQFLDYAGFYTAMLRGVDPSDIRDIRQLKAYLRE